MESIHRETGLSSISLPFPLHPNCVYMKTDDRIPCYAPDGRSLGFRTREAAKSLIARGFVKPAYGRKGHLKAIWQIAEDGSDPIVNHAPAGTKYSGLQNLENGGRCWKLRRLDQRDEDGTMVSNRGAFLQVLTDCLVP